MGYLLALAPMPAVGLLAPPRVSSWRPPAVAAAAFDLYPVGRRSFPSRLKVALFAARRRPFCCRMKGSGSDITSDLELAKFDGKRRPNHNVNGVFWILLLNLGIYVADHILRLQEIKSLYLYHICPVWYQFVTATFCHANWNHLSSNLFFLYIFGKLVEEEQGNFALWISYILAGAGANLVSWLLLPKSAVSVGASGAVFGLFVISVLVKMSWDWRKIIEVLILGQFVIEKVMEAAQASTSLTGTYGRGLMAVNHIAHISGALIGAALVLLVSRIPSQPSGQDDKNKRS
ncbi:rhomboid-like protein 11, chloroplastic isoform X1 [Musa acuminata AAA Group]|uniref:rhomboid-like protein 11, chloroplastic isoform X1 n=1 Tax=Musa acuminata AAA Group TaxID=214697 RepID=UPI0031D3B979